MAISKVVYGDTTLIDISNTTATASAILSGVGAYGADGEWVNGTLIQVHPSDSNPEMDGVAAPGSSLDYARADHVHPHDDTIPSNISDLNNDTGFITGMTILSYGSSTWNDFITAYNAHKVVYCRASSNSNPASGAQTRMAFMAYIGGTVETPTNVEFQYYRSVSSHSYAQQGDQVYVYKLTNADAWSVTVRENYTKIAPGTGLSSAYSNGVLTLSAPNNLPAVSTADNDKVLSVVDGTWAAAFAPNGNIQGVGPPSSLTVGTVGIHYFDTTASDYPYEYICTAASSSEYTWVDANEPLSEFYYGTVQPVDENIKVWINPDGMNTIHELPSGGFENQFLIKNSNTDYDAKWTSINSISRAEIDQIIGR